MVMLPIPALDRLPDPPRCPWCGSKFTSRSRRTDGYFCHSCWRSFIDAPLVAFDFVADGWTPDLAALQTGGELIAVALPSGFLGVCLISVEVPLRRETPDRREVVSR